jgi:hypothetical protein
MASTRLKGRAPLNNNKTLVSWCNAATGGAGGFFCVGPPALDTGQTLAGTHIDPLRDVIMGTG